MPTVMKSRALPPGYMSTSTSIRGGSDPKTAALRVRKRAIRRGSGVQSGLLSGLGADNGVLKVLDAIFQPANLRLDEILEVVVADFLVSDQIIDTRRKMSQPATDSSIQVVDTAVVIDDSENDPE